MILGSTDELQITNNAINKNLAVLLIARKLC